MNEKTVMLVADDDASYSELVEFALEKAQIDAKVIYVCDGEEVIDYLKGAGRFADRNAYPLPDRVMLDVKMPGMTGLETLVWIRQQLHFKNLPVLMITASLDARDMRRAAEVGANYYVIKPAACNDLAHALREFFDTTTSELQDQPPPPMRTRL